MQQHPVGDGALAAVLADPEQRDLVGAAFAHVPVERVEGDVGGRADEPAVVGAVELLDGVPGAAPLERVGGLGPGGVGILDRRAVAGGIALEFGFLSDAFGWFDDLMLGEQRFDVLGHPRRSPSTPLGREPTPYGARMNRNIQPGTHLSFFRPPS